VWDYSAGRYASFDAEGHPLSCTASTGFAAAAQQIVSKLDSYGLCPESKACTPGLLVISPAGGFARLAFEMSAFFLFDPPPANPVSCRDSESVANKIKNRLKVRAPTTINITKVL
jgi:hypothetical protein